jgi:hypothetical protein
MRHAGRVLPAAPKGATFGRCYSTVTDFARFRG